MTIEMQYVYSSGSVTRERPFQRVTVFSVGPTCIIEVAFSALLFQSISISLVVN